MESVDNEVAFVLDKIRENWPDTTGGYGQDYGDSYGTQITHWPGVDGGYSGEYGDTYSGEIGPLVRINRDEPEILETGERRRGLELSNFSAIAAARANTVTTPSGTEYNHDIETVVNVRIEGLNARKHGQIESLDAFETLVAKTRWAILQERSYPCSTSDADDFRRRVYQDLRLENEEDYSHEERDYYRREFDVRFVGKEELSDL